MNKQSQDNQREAILLSYLAGIIDGEGTIRIGATKPSTKHPNWNIVYYASIGLGMSDKRVIELFAKKFGAKLRKECVPNRKIIYRWGTCGNKAVPKILKKLLPYLIVKKKQAELVIKFCEERKTTGFRRNKKLPISELRRRQELYFKIKKLNAVGAPATTKQEDTREGEAMV